MNVTELARILKVTPDFLKQKLPEMGYDIGWKAIKIDNQTAKRIMREWPVHKRRWEREAEVKRREESAASATEQPKRRISIPAFVSVRDFSRLAEIPVNKLLSELMKNGIFTSLNEKIDFETANIVGADLGVEVSLGEDEGGGEDQSAKIRAVLSREADEALQTRPPVVVVMGHVDHGKTKLLDAIRATNVVATEAGGITQHIGAYQVERQGRLISFIDTPGHEAFTAMRNRGAKVADIAILVVAADDGVKPQTVEAYRIIEAAKLPFVVAINKIDKPEANVEKTKQEVANQLNLVPEDWGGKVVCLPVSAKEGAGINDLLDTVLLVADLAEGSLKANPAAKAIGTVVESRVDKGEGVIATLLVQNGTLRLGDELTSGGINYGKVRALKNYLGQSIAEAAPSTPAKVIGFKNAPSVGDIIEVGSGLKVKVKNLRPVVSGESLNATAEDNETLSEQIAILLKGDTLGSLEAIEGSLSKIDTQGVRIAIVAKGLGNISEGDVERAEGTQATLIGFNVKAAPAAVDLARVKNINIKLYKIIYELIADLKSKIQELVKPEIKRVDIGQARVLAIFRTDKNEQIIGCKITEGLVKPAALIEVWRDHGLLEAGRIDLVKIGKEEVDRAETGAECGLKYVGRPVIKVGDWLHFYQEEKIYKHVN